MRKRSALTGLQRCFLVCSLGVALGMRPIGAAEYHVSPSGSDGAAGAGAAPWKTIAHGVSQLKTGDTLTLHAGHYKPGEQITIRTPNTTVRGAPGEKAPLIDGTLVTKRDQGGKIQVILVAGDEVVLEGLEVANGKMHNIIITAKGVTVRQGRQDPFFWRHLWRPVHGFTTRNGTNAFARRHWVFFPLLADVLPLATHVAGLHGSAFMIPVGT